MVLATGACPTLAQPDGRGQQPDSFINQQRAIEERIRAGIEEEHRRNPRGLFDWGGWVSFHLFLFDDGVESSRTLRRHDLRLWGRLRLEGGVHEFHARGRISLIDFNAGDAFDRDEDDVEGPNLERGIYRFDLAKAVRKSTGGVLDYNVIATAGRDLVQLGTGITLAAPLDHVSLNVTWRDFQLKGLAGKTVGSMQDFDLARPASRTRRSFLGAELRYRGFERHEPFVYALWQRDRHSRLTFPLLRSFDYDSFHVGFGSTGEMAKGFRYATEWIYQTGHSFADARFHQDHDIEAWAVLAELEYLSSAPRKGRVAIEYLFGSGDPDRVSSPTNTGGARRADRIDSGFLGFGYRNTGLSFAPRVSNLHMGRVGASCFPWPGKGRFAALEVGTEWFLYHKHHRSAAVSDPTAGRPSGFLGWEMDYFLNWRMDADVAWTARWGAFFPGRAFSDRTTRTFLLIGMTWSF